MLFFMKRYFSAFSIAVTIMLIVHTTFLAYAQKSSDELFGCQQYGRAIHCDLLLNEIQVNEVRANSSLVDPLTTSHLQFVNGKSGQALEMRAEYRESIEIMNSPELNPKQFSISFWMQPTTIEPYGHIVSHSNRNQSAGWQFDVFRSGGNLVPKRPHFVSVFLTLMGLSFLLRKFKSQQRNLHS
jgi:hypothetical protein